MPFFFSALLIPTLSSHYHSFDSFFYVEVWCGVKPYLFQLRRIYVVSFRFLSRNYLVTTPILLRYHQISIQYFPRTLPLFSPWRTPSISLIFIYFYRAHRACIFVQIFIVVTFHFKNLQIYKFCCTFAR